MASVISFSNHKGGVGKTTSVINIGAALAKMGKSVLIVDLDPQANLSQSLGIMEPTHTIYGVLRGLYKPQPIKVVDGLDIIPSTLDLSGAEVELAGEAGREFILREALEPIKHMYNYILLDCAPSLGLLTLNALTMCDTVVVPMQAEYLALQGIAKLRDVVAKISQRLNKGLEIGGVIITQYDSRKVLNREVAEAICALFGDKVLKTKVRENIALAEAPAQQKDIFRYAPKSNGAQDYLEIAKEISLLKSLAERWLYTK